MSETKPASYVWRRWGQRAESPMQDSPGPFLRWLLHIHAAVHRLGTDDEIVRAEALVWAVDAFACAARSGNARSPGDRPGVIHAERTGLLIVVAATAVLGIQCKLGVGANSTTQGSAMPTVTP